MKIPLNDIMHRRPSFREERSGIVEANVLYHVRRAPMFSGVHTQKAGSQRSRKPREFGNIVTGAYKPVRAKHSRFVPVQDSLAIVADSEFSRHAVLSLRQFAQFSQSRNGFRSCWGLDIKDQPIGTFGEVEVVPEPGSLLLLLSAAGVALLPLVFRQVARLR